MEDKDNVLSTPENQQGVSEVKVEKEEESLADSVRIVSPGKLVAKRFFRSRLSMVGLITLIALFAFSFLGPLFVKIYAKNNWEGFDNTKDLEIFTDMSIPDDKREVYTSNSYTEEIDPSLVFVGGNVNNSTLPGIEKVTEDEYGKPIDKKKVYKGTINGVEMYVVVQTGANAAIYRSYSNGEKMLFSCTEYTWDYKTFNQLGKISGDHWLGTDEQGMDVFVRLMYGGRVSLTLGFVVVILETILGVIMGGLAGYFGKWVDSLIMRLVDIFNCLPGMPIMLIISAVLDGTDVNQKYRIYYLMAIMTLLGWSGIARMVRGQILYLREQEYMVAAEALGLSVPRKIFRHLVPNIMPQLIVQMTLGLGGIILSESTLSYLGIGIPIPYAAWGTMISSAQKPEILQYYPNLWVPAGCLIVLAVLAFNFVGDGLRDAFDPKASR